MDESSCMIGRIAVYEVVKSGDVCDVPYRRGINEMS